MKGMPGLYYAGGPSAPGRSPRWVGSVLYVDEDTAEVRRTHARDDARPLPSGDGSAGSRRPSLSGFLHRIVGLTGIA